MRPCSLFPSRVSPLAWLLAGAMVCLLPGLAGAQVKTIEPFLGRWTGVALTEQYQSPGLFGYQQRDLDIEIEQVEGGFAISWITDIHGNEGEEVKRRESSMTYRLVSPGLFEAEGFAEAKSPESVLGRRHSWARILDPEESKDPTLVILVLDVSEDGVANLSRYDRTIDSAGQMLLEFVRDQDGRRVRRVTGKLIPQRQ